MHESSFGRLIGVLVSPGKTFRSIAEWPSWVWPMVVLVLITGSVAYLAAQRTDFEDIMRKQVASTGQEIPADVLEKQIEVAEKVGPLTSLLGGLGLAIVSLVLALVFMVTLRLVGSEINFAGSLAVILHGFMPLAVATLLSLPVILSKDVIQYADIQNGTYLMSNPAFLASEETSAALRAVLASLDVFTFWVLILWAIGFRWVGKVSATTAAVTVGVLWFLYVAGKVGFAAAFSG